MTNLDERIRLLLGETANRPPTGLENRYHDAFHDSGSRKAEEILSVMRSQNVSLDRLGYLSVGGSIGSEIIRVLEDSAVRYGVMLEYSDEAAVIAENSARTLASSKILRVLRGDATQKIEMCRRILESWRDEGKIDGIICSFQAVLHELPTRSPGYEPGYLLGEAIWDWDPCFFFCREPCSAQQWPERIRLAIGGVSSERLEALAAHIAGMLRIQGVLHRSGPQHVLLSRELAGELLFKLFYIEDYLHEIQERTTCIRPRELQAQVESILKNHVKLELVNSESFEQFYQDLGVEAQDTTTFVPLPRPLMFVRLFGRRVSPAIPAAQTESQAECRSIQPRMVQEQVKGILNLPLLPWSPRGSPSLRSLWPDLLIDPRLRPHKEPSSTRRLSDWLGDFRWSTNIALVGAPGAGKSTVLRRVFLDLAENLRSTTAPFPVIGHVLDYAASGNRGVHSLDLALQEARGTGKLVVHFIDGLDEADGAVIERFMVDFLGKLPQGEAAWVACRTEYFFNRLGTVDRYSTLFGETFELLPWDTRDTRRFVKLYAGRSGIPRLVRRFKDVARASPGAKDLLANPFQLTLVLYLLASEKECGTDVYLGGTLHNSFTLYNQFYQHWLERESHRGTSKTGAAAIRDVHTQLAERLFDARSGLGPRGVPIAGEVEAVLRADSALADLLRLERKPSVIVGFRHETIGEYLLASLVLESLRKKDSRLEAVLLRTYTFETNRFVREGLGELDVDQCEALVEQLSARYKEYLVPTVPLSGLNSASDVRLRVREQLLYYIGRVPSGVCPEVLRVAYRNESHRLVIRIAALGAILHGDESIETDYLARLEPGSLWDEDNRTVQLIYFGDARGDMYSFRDSPIRPWQRTRSAIIERLRHNTPRDVRLRWWDLRTLRLFLVSRGDVLGRQETRLVQSIRDRLSLGASTRDHLIASEIDALLRLGGNVVAPGGPGI